MYRLRERARIRRQIPSRKSVQEGLPDRLADLLDEAAKEIESLRSFINLAFEAHPNLDMDIEYAIPKKVD